MLYSYPGCFFQRPDGKYCVVFSDLNNLAAFGDDFNSALSNAVELLARYIYNLIINRQSVPEPTDINTLTPGISDEYTRAFIHTVNVDVEEYMKYRYSEEIKKTVSIPRWLDEFAKSKNIDISAMVNEILMQKYKENIT